MKITENISPEIAAYSNTLQAENSKLQNEVSDLKTKVEKQELQISNLTEMFVNSRKKIFGKSSEKSKYFNDAQMSLFNEAEACADPSAPEPEKETFIAAHKRSKKRTKAEITEKLNHIKQVCDLDKKDCEICGGELTCIGYERQHGYAGYHCLHYAAEVPARNAAHTTIKVSQRAWRRGRQQYSCKLGDKKLSLV